MFSFSGPCISCFLSFACSPFHIFAILRPFYHCSNVLLPTVRPHDRHYDTSQARFRFPPDALRALYSPSNHQAASNSILNHTPSSLDDLPKKPLVIVSPTPHPHLTRRAVVCECVLITMRVRSVVVVRECLAPLHLFVRVHKLGAIRYHFFPEVGRHKIPFSSVQR